MNDKRDAIAGDNENFEFGEIGFFAIFDLAGSHTDIGGFLTGSFHAHA